MQNCAHEGSGSIGRTLSVGGQRKPGRPHSSQERRTCIQERAGPLLAGSALIPLTRGMVAIVDKADFEHLATYAWHAWRSPLTGAYYARRSVRTLVAGRWTCRVFSMHREVFGAARRVLVDHKNQNTLDNRRSNLRVATRSQNRANSKHQASGTGYRGVTRDKRMKKGNMFYAAIKHPGGRKYLGAFPTAGAAAKAWDSAARKFHGKFAALNFPV